MTSQYLSSRKNNKVINTTPYDIHSSEQTLPFHMCTKLAQVRANKSQLLQTCLNTVNPGKAPRPDSIGPELILHAGAALKS